MRDAAFVASHMTNNIRRMKTGTPNAIVTVISG
jgi:hypothetical protein